MEPKIIAWRPDGLGDGRTWSEIMAVIARTEGPILITCPQEDADYRIDSGVTDFKRAPVQIIKDNVVLELRKIKRPAPVELRAQPMNRHQRRTQQKLDRLRRNRR